MTSIFDNPEFANSYDNHFLKVNSVRDNLFLLTQIIVQDLPDSARILCVGSGTGTEIIHFAKLFPEWRFVGVEPSSAMLEVCHKKVAEAGLESRCEFISGYLEDFPETEPFDAVFCLFVTQFLTDKIMRQKLFDGMFSHLKKGGCLINSEISTDMSSPNFDEHLDIWKKMHAFTGAKEEALVGIEKSLSESLAVVSPNSIEQHLQRSGFVSVYQFFQSFFMRAWYSKK